MSQMAREAIPQKKEHWSKTQKTWILVLVPNCTNQNTLGMSLSFSEIVR